MTAEASPLTTNSNASGKISTPDLNHRTTLLVRMFGWAILSSLVVFLINDYLTFWMGWPGEGTPLGFGSGNKGSVAYAWLQLACYPVAIAMMVLYVLRTGERNLRADSVRISNINTFIIRAAFFAVLYVGITDAVISFMRVEGFLPGVFGNEMAINLGKSLFRGPYVHMPLVGVAIITAMFSRTLGFTWLALLVIVAELLIVISRFIFSYEQVFMGDLVRFWYASLFLFASAYTLLEEGHVRVDVFYTMFSAKKKGMVNAVGSLFLGVSLCWVVLFVGMDSKSSVINSPILAFETTQTGFGMYVKYMMAGFLALFAISMMIQFVSYLLDAVADIRGEPGGRDHDVHAIQ
ncbi:MAG: TRAP transporter small permease subunit [Alphaproteobacteria bacterium]|jgi:TRAP-type mannitol/chloroaromatic compound transport system permease small subunit|nr:TRAP transporter small permease subunit [Alphaproteobacteria bacterium]MBT7944137.1 TRAP transporter small permease subunit [Alphaproteobacteria bacterium]